jgi:hypothetical protein
LSVATKSWVADQHARAGHGLPRAEAVTGDPDVDRRDLQTPDGPDNGGVATE